MPSEEDHINLAVANQVTLEFLMTEHGTHYPWVATVAFYKAVHISEAVFSRNVPPVHFSGHSDRNEELKTKYPNLWKQFRPLWAASLIARYLEDSNQGRAPYKTFRDYMTPEKVETELIDNRLQALVIEAKPLLTPKYAAKL